MTQLTAPWHIVNVGLCRLIPVAVSKKLAAVVVRIKESKATLLSLSQARLTTGLWGIAFCACAAFFTDLLIEASGCGL